MISRGPFWLIGLCEVNKIQEHIANVSHFLGIDTAKCKARVQKLHSTVFSCWCLRQWPGPITHLWWIPALPLQHTGVSSNWISHCTLLRLQMFFSCCVEEGYSLSRKESLPLTDKSHYPIFSFCLCYSDICFSPSLSSTSFQLIVQHFATRLQHRQITSYHPPSSDTHRLWIRGHIWPKFRQTLSRTHTEQSLGCHFFGNHTKQAIICYWGLKVFPPISLPQKVKVGSSSPPHCAQNYSINSQVTSGSTCAVR